MNKVYRRIRRATTTGRTVELRGFTLMEILVAVSIIAVLTAVLLPALASKMRDARTSAIAGTLQGLSQGIAEYKKATTQYPGKLSLLTTPPDASSPNSCNQSTTAFALWRGPYVSREMQTAGTRMGDAVIQDQLIRVSGTSTYLQIDVTGVESSTATDLESMFDATASPSTGTIRESGPHAALTEILYTIPINGC